MQTEQIQIGKYQADDHIITATKDEGLVCDCQFEGDCQHIKQVLEDIRSAKYGASFRIMERSQLKLCKYCNSKNLKKWGVRKTKQGQVQTFKCADCNKRFTANFGFEKMRYNEVLITRSLQMYFTGMSVRDIADCFEQENIKVSYRTIYNWVSKYSRMVSNYVNGIIPRVGNWFRADEVWVKINGKQCYLFASMDDETRYWLSSDLADNKFQHNADNLLLMTKQQAGKAPRNFITDGLPAYKKSAKRVFGKKTYHISNAGIRSKKTNKNIHPTNNKMERLNGEIRDREKVFRGLKKMDTEILNGMKVYYNFTKKHSGINGKTPAEQAGIKVDGINKWKTLIQNAKLYQISN